MVYNGVYNRTPKKITVSLIQNYKFVTSKNFIALKTKYFTIRGASLIEVQKILYD
jgi:hypothetical protein